MSLPSGNVKVWLANVLRHENQKCTGPHTNWRVRGIGEGAPGNFRHRTADTQQSREGFGCAVPDQRVATVAVTQSIVVGFPLEQVSLRPFPVLHGVGPGE